MLATVRNSSFVKYVLRLCLKEHTNQDLCRSSQLPEMYNTKRQRPFSPPSSINITGEKWSVKNAHTGCRFIQGAICKDIQTNQNAILFCLWTSFLQQSKRRVAFQCHYDRHVYSNMMKKLTENWNSMRKQRFLITHKHLKMSDIIERCFGIAMTPFSGKQNSNISYRALK